MKHYKTPIHIVLADDHPLFLEGLATLLKKDTDISIVGTGLDGEEVLKILADKEVDIVLTDLQMPGMDGAQLSEQIRNRHPRVKILVLSMRTDKSNVAYLMHQGASGYVFKNSERDVILKAIKTIAAGGTWFPEEIRPPSSETEDTEEEDPRMLLAKLSKRETEVLTLLAKEYTSQEIANELFIGSRTVESHRQSLLRKLNVRNSIGLVKQAVRLGLAD